LKVSIHVSSTPDICQKGPHAFHFYWLLFTSNWHSLIILLAERPQCCCGEIRQILTFLINIITRNLIKGLTSIRIVEYHRKNYPETQHLYRYSNPGQFSSLWP
jgi:hypothetical protein